MILLLLEEKRNFLYFFNVELLEQRKCAGCQVTRYTLSLFTLLSLEYSLLGKAKPYTSVNIYMTTSFDLHSACVWGAYVYILYV